MTAEAFERPQTCHEATSSAARCFLFLSIILVCRFSQADVVINEIFYHPESECEREEFIELFNSGPQSTNLAGWSFVEGILYEIPEGTFLGPGEHLVICRDPSAFEGVFGKMGNLLGPYKRHLDNDGESLVLIDAGGRVVDRVSYDDKFPWPVNADGLGSSLELVHPLAENEGPDYWRPSVSAVEGKSPTPGRRNSRYSALLPPFVKSVSHQPRSPTSFQAVTVVAQILDTSQHVSVNLLYQVVPPGHYIRLTDPQYETDWISVPMRDDGIAPDRRSGDGFYVAVLPAQQHRALVRYRVHVVNSWNESTLAPYPSDSSPNFAYFVYDGVPPYEAFEPVRRTHTVLEKVPIYQLIAAKEDTDECQYVPVTDRTERRLFKWRGTFVAGGEVYDHIRFRLRGGVWRYTFNKRMWKIRLNQGLLFRGMDNDGRPFAQPRKTINLNSVTQNMKIPNPHRGECGLFEWTGFLLFKMVGVGAPETTFVHFRIIDEEDEAGTDQYSGDFYGIYLDIEQPDERFLRTNGYSPNCNLYKMNRNWTVDGKIWEKETNNCNPEDDSDIRSFYRGYNRYGTSYLREHLDIEKYLSYRCILEAIHHYDVYAEKNYYYVNNIETGLWEVLPWDLDITFGSDHGDGKEPFRDLIVGHLSSRRPKPGPYATEFRNRLREVCQLLYNENVLFPILEQARDLIVELAAADRDRWDYFKPLDAHPSKAHYKSLDERLEEMKNWIRKRIHEDYVDANGNFVMSLENMYADPDIPRQPSVLSPPDGEEILQGRLVLTSSTFSDPNPSSRLAGVRWIVTRIGGNELKPDWSAEKPGEDGLSLPVPGDVLAPGVLYRCRVRHRDETGRWSLWSEPVIFSLRPNTGVKDWSVR